MRLPLPRRRLLGLLAGAALLSACGSALESAGTEPPDARDRFPPIVFVHGNGDSAALWITTVWRFESNGWPRDRLHAIDLPYPLARDDDTRPQQARSSSSEQRQFLAAEVERVRARTGAARVVLIGSSRGGYAIRSYIAQGGAAAVSHAVLCGTPNHGVWHDPRNRPGNEFNGAGPFLAALNAPQGPDGAEVTPGVQWLTIRSDQHDKFAQPDGAWLGTPGVPTQVGFDSPALKGAENVVLFGADHRETAFSRHAFHAMWRFLTGAPPATLDVRPEVPVVLDGVVSGQGLGNDPARGSEPTNLPLVGASVEVFATDAATGQRLGDALHRRTVGADGRWGPFEARPDTPHEFVIRARGYAVTHVYRTPFPRSSSIVHLRAERIAPADRDALSIVTLSRPRGYFGLPRDQIVLDGRSPPTGIPAGVPGVSVAKLKLNDLADRAVAGQFNGERIVGRAWRAADHHVVILELLH